MEDADPTRVAATYSLEARRKGKSAAVLEEEAAAMSALAKLPSSLSPLSPPEGLAPQRVLGKMEDADPMRVVATYSLEARRKGKRLAVSEKSRKGVCAVQGCDEVLEEEAAAMSAAVLEEEAAAMSAAAMIEAVLEVDAAAMSALTKLPSSLSPLSPPEGLAPQRVLGKMEDADPTRKKRVATLRRKARKGVCAVQEWDRAEEMRALAFLSLSPPSPPEERERRKESGAIIPDEELKKEKQHVAETAQFPSRPPVQGEMMPRDARKMKKKVPPVAVGPSTPALDSRKEKKVPSKKPFVEAALAAYRARREKEKETEPDEESGTDLNANEAHLYRKFWNDMYAGEECGSYEDTTSIPPMCFTDSFSQFADVQPTLQFFSVKIEDVTGGLSWPLDVYGVVAIRDVVDHNRNIIFYRERDSCQTIDSTEPFLALTGPTRAVVVTVHPTYFEVDLKVKGAVQSEDKDLSLLAVCYTSNGPCTSLVRTRVATSKLSTLKFTFGHIVNSVEATVNIEILGGKWPEGYQKGVFTAGTASIKGMDITLLSFGDGKLPVANGQVKLVRRVICVELVPGEADKVKPKLLISVKALHANENIGKVGRDLSFKPKSRGRSFKKIKVDSCEMQVTVAWSLLSTFKGICEKAMSARAM